MSGGGALAGLRVLDAATFYAAPLISSLLADHGADVVRLEPPGGDPYRSRAPGLWALTVRNKRSLVLDLDAAADRARLHALIARLDVVVVNEPEPRLRRRGLDPDTLLGLNQDLVLVRFSGFGLDGPYATRPGNGTLGEALAGLTHLTGEPDGPPMLPALPLGDAVSAFAGAFGVLAACHRRAREGGGGQIVDVNPLDTLLHVTAPSYVAYDGGEPPRRTDGAMPGAPLRGVFATADGGWLVLGLSSERQLIALRDLVQPAVASEDRARTDELPGAVRAWLAARGRAEAVAALVAAGVPAVPVNDARDLGEDPHLAGRDALRSVPSPDGQTFTVPAPAPRLSGGAAHRDPSLPQAGEHTEDVLRDWSR